MRKLLIVILCLVFALSMIACNVGEISGANKEDEQSKPETTSSEKKDSEVTTKAEEKTEITVPPGYHSLNTTMTTDEIYSTEPYASFIPSKEAMATAGFTNAKNHLLGEPEKDKPWTCLNSTWKRLNESIPNLVVTVLHVNSPYPYGGGNKTDITIEAFTIDVVKSAVEQDNDFVLVKHGEYVASYSTSLAPTAEELYALITTAPCFLNYSPEISNKNIETIFE